MLPLTTCMSRTIRKSLVYGIVAAASLLGAYFAVLTFVSGWDYALDQFLAFRYFIVGLAFGFGIQIGLYIYLRDLIVGGGAVLGITGTTSTAAMVSCCMHYLANLLPILGAVGAVTFVAQYQVELFWVALAFNAFGIAFMLRRIIRFRKQHEH